MTLDDVPPGQQPTRMTPAATSGDIGMIFVSATASSGMMRNCDRTPMPTSNGRFTTSRKSSTDIVSPMPNMMMARSVTIHGAICLNVSGNT